MLVYDIDILEAGRFISDHLKRSNYVKVSLFSFLEKNIIEITFTSTVFVEIDMSDITWLKLIDTYLLTTSKPIIFYVVRYPCRYLVTNVPN